jgi:DNA-binding MarR family transcriptional regulator
MSEDLEFRDCAGCVCAGLRRASRVMNRHFARHLRPTGIRGTQFSMLAVLLQGGPMPLSRVARRLSVERTTLTRNLRPLIAKGWVTVDEGDDRRIHTVTITEAGRAQARKALPAWRAAQASARSKLAELRLDAVLKVIQ